MSKRFSFCKIQINILIRWKVCVAHHHHHHHHQHHHHHHHHYHYYLFCLGILIFIQRRTSNNCCGGSIRTTLLSRMDSSSLFHFNIDLRNTTGESFSTIHNSKKYIQSFCTRAILVRRASKIYHSFNGINFLSLYVLNIL